MERTPTDLTKALNDRPGARSLWQSLTPIARRDFVSWIESARQPETRKRRVERACDMVAKGKRRPCCYSAVPLGLYRALAADPAAQARWKALTPSGRRDVVDWVNSLEGVDARERRIEEACRRLSSGKI